MRNYRAFVRERVTGVRSGDVQLGKPSVAMASATSFTPWLLAAELIEEGLGDQIRVA